MPAEIKVRIGGAWVDVGGAAPAGEEVVVGGAEPTDAVTELWYDEADPGTSGTPDPPVVSHAPGAVTTFGLVMTNTYQQVCTTTLTPVTTNRLVLVMARFLFGYTLVPNEQMDVNIFVNGADTYQFACGIPGIHMVVPLGSLALVQPAGQEMTITMSGRTVGATAGITFVDGSMNAYAFHWAYSALATILNPGVPSGPEV